MFRSFFRTHENCSHCDAPFEREKGFFLGSIYFNYGLTALIVAIAYPVILFNGWLSENMLLGASLAFTIVFPIWFFRYSRSLWAGFDEYFDPRDSASANGSGEGSKTAE